jgi:hypothetical protein
MYSHINRYRVKNLLPLLIPTLAIIAVVVISLNNCYFWDNIRQTSVEAHWFMKNGLQGIFTLPEAGDSSLARTGYHPPLVGLMTAMLWKIFGYSLAVSHIFTGLWALGLVYFTFRITGKFLPPEIAATAIAVMLLDSTILAQTAIASPDIILLTCFMAAVYAVTDRKNVLLAVALLLMVLVNGRGMISAAAIFLFSVIHRPALEGERHGWQSVAVKIIPFVPAFLIIAAYYTIFIAGNGGVMPANSTEWGEGWLPPEGLTGLLKNFAAFMLRILENGRFIIFLIAAVLIFRMRWAGFTRFLADRFNRALLAVFISLATVFLLFALSTRLVISSRYYMGMMLIFTILLYRMAAGSMSIRSVKIMSLVVAVALITGNLWIYPESIAKAWDGTLAHMPFYKAREECIAWLSDEEMDVSAISAGFCRKGNQRYIDLRDRDMIIGDDIQNRYFLYSNISNVDDYFAEELKDKGKWVPLKEFRNGNIFIRLYENNLYRGSE